MGAKLSRTDFEYVYTDEPHATRRKEIIAKYPQVKELYRADHSMLVIVPLMVAFQVFMCWMVRDASWPITFALAYILGGTINQSLMLAMHEITHNAVFPRNYFATKVFGIFSTLPTGLPASISFKKYHSDHHKYLGADVIDPDLPHPVEAAMFNRSITKVIWLILNPFIYVTRPVILNPKPITGWELVAIVVQMTFNYFIIQYVGGAKGFFYLLGGLILSSGLHPIAGHFLSEHYVFFDKNQQTGSYYGPMNYLTWNIGYHNEHHDFPWISYRKLPKLKAMAPEYYDNLPHHTSWIKCLLDFILRPDMGLYARTKNMAMNKNEIKKMGNDSSEDSKTK